MTRKLSIIANTRHSESPSWTQPWGRRGCWWLTAALLAGSGPAFGDGPFASLEGDRFDAEIRLGPFDVQPRLSVGLTYDDNILISSHAPLADQILTLNPAFLAVAGDRLWLQDYRARFQNVVGLSPGACLLFDDAAFPGPMLLLDYGPRFNWFARYEENNSVDQLVSANLLWPFSRLVLGTQQEFRDENTTIIEAGQRTRRQSTLNAVSGAWEFGAKSSAEWNLMRQHFAYETLSGFTDWGGDSWFNYRAGERVQLGAGVRAGFLEVDADPGQTYEQVLLRARYFYAERLTLEGAVGVQARQFESGREPTYQPVARVAAAWQPTPRSEIALQGYRRDQASVHYGQNAIVSGASLTVRQHLGDRWVLNAGIGHDTFNYYATSPGASGRGIDHANVGRAGAAVALFRGLALTVHYEFRTLSSTSRDGFDNHQVSSQLKWEF